MKTQHDLPSASDALRETLAELEDELVAFRRDLHSHPELAGAEVRTTTVVADRLTAAGLRVRLLAGSGLVADIGPVDPAYRVALRADLDALPVVERTGLPFASLNDGVCHACGHDLHITAVLGAGLALQQHVESLTAQGTGVRLIFQPSEEVTPGGEQGVIRLGGIACVTRIFSIACHTTCAAGHVGLRDGTQPENDLNVHGTHSVPGGAATRAPPDLSYQHP